MWYDFTSVEPSISFTKIKKNLKHLANANIETFREIFTIKLRSMMGRITFKNQGKYDHIEMRALNFP